MYCTDGSTEVYFRKYYFRGSIYVYSCILPYCRILPYNDTTFVRKYCTTFIVHVQRVAYEYKVL
jgi:hypothetical protein